MSIVEEQLKEAVGEDSVCSATGVAQDSKADAVINLVLDQAELFHDSSNSGFATITIKNHKETWAIQSKGFENWLAMSVYKELGFALTDNVKSQVLVTIDGIAKFGQPDWPDT